MGAFKIVYLGLGSNLAQPRVQIKRALGLINNLQFVRVEDCSSLYVTAPVGYADQPDFINAVARIRTKLHPSVLLNRLQFIERKHLRVRTENQNAARTLDLDILIYDRLQCASTRLTVPHPRMIERRFVLEPLLEIDADIFIPGQGFGRSFFPAVANQSCKRCQRIVL